MIESDVMWLDDWKVMCVYLAFKAKWLWNEFQMKFICIWCIKQTQNRKSKVGLLCRLSLLFSLLFIFTVLLFLLGSGLPFLSNKIKGSKCVLWQNKSASTLWVQCEGGREVNPWAGKPFGEAWSFKTWSEGAHITVHSSPLHAQTVKKSEFLLPKSSLNRSM